ncbi:MULTISPECIES: LuxR C-terminal-related transcriptional regulator [unclassified Pseudofrankia]|uniref:LuxR C-terminal-related transcriptional regulator n=1 Tax=unclassified Pseudofrankia TaxID=2994372 RepID=UPI0008D93A40|nr:MULTISPECIES: LuxR C-terminal-related transcriptional regulator [unclassified Pseudofrankia]MDT3440768.1 LuxR C-terminal-related transcriptional regulator [Pseudofrankia sp. BMG5.37]OHV64730.1 LuxR family transcriptional regulator [Pseudofrankia sp. BMG5.36]
MASEPSDCAEADEFLAKVTSRLRERFDADIALAGRVHPRTRMLTIRCADGARTDQYLGATAAPDQGIGGRVVALGRHVVTASRDGRAHADAAGQSLADCHEGIRSVLAVPLRLDGRLMFVFYLAWRAGRPMEAVATNAALSFARQVESFAAQAARTHGIDVPQRWNVDSRVLLQIDSELERLTLEVSAPPARARIAAIRNLLEDSVLESMAGAEEATVALTRRELDVLGLVAEGLSNAETAERLVVSPETVKAYLRTIRSKLGVRNRTAAVAVARRSGLLQ